MRACRARRGGVVSCVYVGTGWIGGVVSFFEMSIRRLSKPFGRKT